MHDQPISPGTAGLGDGLRVAKNMARSLRMADLSCNLVGGVEEEPDTLFCRDYHPSVIILGAVESVLG